MTEKISEGLVQADACAVASSEKVTKPFEKRINRALRPDAQAFDEVRITTVPRWKESELSGSEWRISAKIEFFRKGELIHEEYRRDVEKACQHVGYLYDAAVDDAKGYFGGIKGICDQEGCSQAATVSYRKKQEYDRSGHAHPILCVEDIRCFCDRHKHRGDCGLDDSDDNYEVFDPAAPSDGQVNISNDAERDPVSLNQPLNSESIRSLTKAGKGE